MLKLKLLISLYNKFIFLTCTLLLTSACSLAYLYDSNTEKYINNIYVLPVAEESGMFFASQLKYFFPNQDLNIAKYFLKTNIQIIENLHLSDKYGFATQGELWLTIHWQIIDKNDNKVYITSYNFIPAYYHIMLSYYATQNNKEQSIKLALKLLAKNISLKIMSLLKDNNGNFTNTAETKLDNNNLLPLYYEDNTSKN